MTGPGPALDLTLIDSTGDPTGQTRPLLEEFERNYPATVRVTAFSSDDAWNELVKTAIYRHGPDVFQFGTTWFSSFQSVKALRPFTDREVLGLGRQHSFVSAAWQSCQADAGPVSALWAAPRISDTIEDNRHDQEDYPKCSRARG